MFQEGIDVQEMAISAFIACVFLAFFINIFGYNQNVQTLLEREQTHQQLEQAYARVAAYDDSDINGQDVLSFLTKYKGSIPVIFVETDNQNNINTVITDNTDDLEARARVGGDSEYQQYRIYSYTSTGKAELGADAVYQTDASKFHQYEEGNPTVGATSSLTAQEIIDGFSDYIKDFRKDQTGKSDGLYGKWHSVVFYSDTSCRMPECIKVWPLND